MDISQSKLKTWRGCRKAYFYKYVMKITKKYKPLPFMRGTIIHNMMEAHYLGKDPWKSFKRDMAANEKAIRINPEEYGDLGTHLKVLMKGYFDYYADEDLKPIKVEHNFRTKLVGKIFLTGKIDLIAKHDKLRWMTEHKCHNTIPTGIIPYANLQSSLYVWAYNKEADKPLDGVMWNYLWGKVPSIPKPLKNGEMSRKKSSTTWAIYKHALLEAGLDPKEYLDVKKALRGNEEQYYQRQKLPIDKTMMNTIVEDTKTTALEIEKLAGKDQTRNLGYNCQRCEFKNLCVAQLKGLDTNFILKAEFKERKKEDEERHRTED